MELTKQDTQMAKGIAVLGMVMLHLFCRVENLPYTPMIWCGDVPLVYYLGLFGDLCVPVFCFCSGYAHYLMANSQTSKYARRIPEKAIRFLCNYWIVVMLFSVIGLIFDESGKIPGSWADFAGNMLVVGMNYNGAWWFVTTYLLLLALSPLLAALTKQSNGIVLLMISGIVYFVAYQLRFNYIIEYSNSVLRWFCVQTILLGTSQLGYFAGMACRKYEVIGKLRNYLNDRTTLRRSIMLGLPLTAFVGHCVIQSAFVAPFTAAAVLIGLFLAKLPGWAERCFLLLGKHSTNIWLVHMFFYLSLFKGLVFYAKYPLCITVAMFALCIGTSYVISCIYSPICTRLIQHSTTKL